MRHHLLTLAALALVAAGPALAQVPQIDTSTVTGMKPGDVARRALGAAAASYPGVAVVELGIEQDSPGTHLEPNQWAVLFFHAPQAVGPGICHVTADEVGVVRGSPIRTNPEFGTMRAVEVRPHSIYRIVGALAARPDAAPDAATTQACTALIPVQDQFLDRDPYFPGAPGAFDAASTVEAWQAATFARRLGQQRDVPKVDCVLGPGTCDEALALLRTDPIAPIYRIDTAHCTGAAKDEVCAELSLMLPQSGNFCVLRFITPAMAPTELHAIRLTCNPPDPGVPARRIE